MRRCALSLALLLAACAAENEPEITLSSLQIRYYLGGHTLTGTENGRRFNFTLLRSGIGRYIDEETAEFAPWSTYEDQLCMRWRDRPETCAPLVQIGVAHFHWDGLGLTDLDLGLKPSPLRMHM
jgi:hypothetical protein